MHVVQAIETFSYDDERGQVYIYAGTILPDTDPAVRRHPAYFLDYPVVVIPSSLPLSRAIVLVVGQEHLSPDNDTIAEKHEIVFRMPQPLYLRG